MRIAVITETFEPDINGVARSLRMTLAGLLKMGWQIDLHCLQGSGEAFAAQFPGVRLIPHRGFALPFYQDVRLGFTRPGYWGRQWREQPVDLVYVITEGPLGFSAIRTARRMNLPVISAFHTNFHAYSRYYRMGFIQHLLVRYLRILHRYADLTLVPSDAQQNQLKQMGFEHLEVLRHGVDTQVFNPQFRDNTLREQWGAHENEPVILYVGRIASEKNIECVLAAYQHARKTLPALRCVVVGDGPLRSILSKENPEVIFSGALQGQELSRHFASADMFVFASETETFGLVTLEAMASGLAIYSYDLAAAGLFVTPANGELIEPGNAAAFVEKFPAFAAREDIQQLGLHARECAVGQSWHAQILRLASLCVQVVNQPEADAQALTH